MKPFHIIYSTKRGASPGYLLMMSFFYSNLEPSKEAANLPAYLWALRHTKRQAKHFSNPPPGRFKPIFDMNVVRGVFSHGSLLCLSGE